MVRCSQARYGAARCCRNEGGAGERGPRNTGAVRADGAPFAHQGTDEALGLVIHVGGLGAGAQMPELEGAPGTPRGKAALAASIVGHDAPPGDALSAIPSARALDQAGNRPPALIGQALTVDHPKQSSMAEWTYSQPTPRTRVRRSPWMRYSTPAILPSFLISRCTTATGRRRS